MRVAGLCSEGGAAWREATGWLDRRFWGLRASASFCVRGWERSPLTPQARSAGLAANRPGLPGFASMRRAGTSFAPMPVRESRSGVWTTITTAPAACWRTTGTASGRRSRRTFA